MYNHILNNLKVASKVYPEPEQAHTDPRSLLWLSPYSLRNNCHKNERQENGGVDNQNEASPGSAKQPTPSKFVNESRLRTVEQTDVVTVQTSYTERTLIVKDRVTSIGEIPEWTTLCFRGDREWAYILWGQETEYMLTIPKSASSKKQAKLTTPERTPENEIVDAASIEDKEAIQSTMTAADLYSNIDMHDGT